MGVSTAAFPVFATSQIGTAGPANMALMLARARLDLRPALPLVAGVALGKQIIVWPLGARLMRTLASAPPDPAVRRILAGLRVQPPGPMALAMAMSGITGFSAPGTPALQATLVIAMCLLACEVVLRPLWTLAEESLARLVAGIPAERFLMVTLAGLIVPSFAAVPFLGGEA